MLARNSLYLGDCLEVMKQLDDHSIDMILCDLPCSVLKFSKDYGHLIHSSQKPVKLFEWLIKTYSNPGDLILDSCSGSGTTAIACINSQRDYICIEKDELIFEASRKRINEHTR
jgi:site-specific DNA-methyltransferase (adenine-specific)